MQDLDENILLCLNIRNFAKKICENINLNALPNNFLNYLTYNDVMQFAEKMWSNKFVFW